MLGWILIAIGAWLLLSVVVAPLVGHFSSLSGDCREEER